MELNVYNSEKFDRHNLWYVIFWLVTAGTLTGSIFYKNRAGAILLFFLLGGYFFYSVKNSWPITMTIMDGWLKTGGKIFPRSNLSWFVIEFDTNANKVKNIVLVTRNSHSIHTIHDTQDNLKNFVNTLSNYTPMLEKYNQTTREKIMRKIKL